jgi:hypothetical protein
MAMDNIEKRYERRGSIRPCSLSGKDLADLTAIILETFTPEEIDKYFRVSTNLGNTRVFSNSVEDFFSQKNLPERITDLSFWIEGWDKQTRFDKVILLDFSKYSVQLSVEGIDPVWVYDKYDKIAKFLKSKFAWYWPMVIAEKVIIFSITIILISNIILSLHLGKKGYFAEELALFGLWLFLIFYDTRKVWPYANIRLKKHSVWSPENLFMGVTFLVLAWALVSGIILPLAK